MTEGYTLGPEDIKLFLTETVDQLELLEEEIVRLEGEGHDTALLQDMFRIAHTVKGSSATVGHSAMSTLAHAMEDVFAALRDGRLSPERELVNVLLDAIDSLKGLAAEFNMEDAARGDMMSVDSLVARLLKTISPDSGAYTVEVRFAADTAMPAVRALQVLQALGEVGRVTYSHPSLEEIQSGKADLRCRAVLVAAPDVSGTDIERVLREISDVEGAVVERDIEQTEQDGAAGHPEETARDGEDESLPDNGLQNNGAQDNGTPVAGAAAQGARRVLGRSSDQTIRIDVTAFDRLVRMVSELAIDEARLIEILKRLAAMYRGTEHIQELEQITAHMGRLTTELQEEVMKARMTPLASLFRRFPRMVRDTAANSGKRVEFVVEGEDTELDRALISQIADPIIHLLRNAVGHGIERPEERLRTGKPEAGTVRLSASHVEDRVVISVEDDGAGIHPDRVRESAVRKGIITPERAAALADEEAVELIFRPGFSTAAQVNDVSGRGVGLDIVRANVERLGGTIRTRTSPGQGSTFVLSVPLTLAVFRALLVISAGQEFAIPLSAVVEVTRVPISEVKPVGGGSAIVLRGSVLPVFDLHEFAGREDAAADKREKAFIVVARYEDMRVGLIVDSLLGEQEIVIKSLGTLARCAKGLLGGAILGDGRVALILDVARILEKALGRTRVSGQESRGGMNDGSKL